MLSQQIPHRHQHPQILVPNLETDIVIRSAKALALISSLQPTAPNTTSGLRPSSSAARVLSRLSNRIPSHAHR